MKITAQEEYGVRCLLRLARSTQPVTITEIASYERLSYPYAAKLLAILKQARLIESERGRSGGFRLARSSEAISLREVLSVLGEPLFDPMGFCQRHSGTQSDGTCVHDEDCALRAVWSVLGSWTRQVLDRISLADLVREEGAVAGLVRRHLMAVIDEPSSLVQLQAGPQPVWSEGDQGEPAEPIDWITAQADGSPQTNVAAKAWTSGGEASP